MLGEVRALTDSSLFPNDMHSHSYNTLAQSGNGLFDKRIGDMQGDKKKVGAHLCRFVLHLLHFTYSNQD